MLFLLPLGLLNTRLILLSSVKLTREYSARRDEGQTLATRIIASLTDGQQDIINRIIASNGQLFSDLEQSITESERRNAKQVIVSEQNIVGRLQTDKDDVRQREARQRLLKSLEFDTINQRQNFIRNRVGDYGKTYSWIFEPGQGHGFREWLVSGNGIFWINGKPGSGKSSLVDYIVDHLHPGKPARPLLEEWASPLPLKVLSFFFYKPANEELQKTFHGLWRSLCFQVLADDLALCDTILNDADLPLALKRYLGMDLDFQNHWMTKDLKTFFLYLKYKISHKVFVILDGLDEFAENHTSLLETVKELSSVSDLKLCCASRPDAPFNQGFSTTAKMRLQDLTYGDIEHVVHDRLQGTLASSLAEKIVWRSEGVFLWAHLILQDIMRGIAEGADLAELTARVADAPGEMKDLFNSMLERAHSSYLKRPKPYLQYILLGRQMRQKTLISELLFTEMNQEELEICLRDGFSVDFIRLLNDGARTIKAQVLARCGGLVYTADSYARAGNPTGKSICQTSFSVSLPKDFDRSALDEASGTVLEFIHRTAFDFLTEDSGGQHFVASCSISENEAYLNLLRANVARIYLGWDHPLEDCESEYTAYFHLDKISSLESRLEKAPMMHQYYHHLTASWLEKLVADFWLSSQSPTLEQAGHQKVHPLWNVLGCRRYPAGVPLGLMVETAHACTHGLWSFLTMRALSLPLEQRQTLVAMIWILASDSWTYERGQLQDSRIYLDFVASLQWGNAEHLVTPMTNVRSLMCTTQEDDVIELRTQRIYILMLSVLLERALAGSGRRMRFGHIDGTAREVFGTLLCTEVLASGSFDLTIVGSHAEFWLVLPEWRYSISDILRHYLWLKIRCTIENLVCLLMPGRGYPEWGLPGTGDLPCLVQWSPHSCNRFFTVGQEQPPELWLLRDGHFILNPECVVHVPEQELDELSEAMRSDLREDHSEAEPGRLLCFTSDFRDTLRRTQQ
ncbi:uncharacterized protein HMPREF1541_06315 [Cyphellophora europaea CBS 101466]|uniref:Nephrocystin 3-like N-terminal domain-containing protein n=1 Tax=Cyphellophora europaea (strain CBS 101466) TaxID=1220924 RepID=W2RRC5_CYPE1|nr:uncharacterized protein HMPREF1541_06315 [Cyphellophora europaea CBS 101466]ETN38284.1 hypothetical protein HMPREF1541_06315 [Cyphellophora europaea CBS 101466]